MKLHKHIIMVILLLGVFAVGTLNFVDTVNAATNSIDIENKYCIESKEKSVKWKKFDSGSYDMEKPISGYKKKATFVSHDKGPNEIRMTSYVYRSKDNKKVRSQTLYLSKKGNKVKMYEVDIKGKKSKTETVTVKSNGILKNGYKNILLLQKNIKSTYLKSIGNSNSGSSGISSSGSSGRQVYVPPVMGYVHKWNPNKYNPSSNTYGAYDYVWDVVTPGRWEWKPW